MNRFSGKASWAVVFWGSSFVATRMALRWLTPTGLVLVRLLIGSVSMWCLASLFETRRGLAPADRGRLVLLGLILAGHLLIQNVGLLKTTAANTGWIIGFIPATIAVGAFVFLKERLTGWAWVGIALGAGGILLVSLSSGFGFSQAKVGDLLQLSSCFTWTAYTLLAIGPIRRNGALPVTVWSLAVAAVATGVASPFFPFTCGIATTESIVAVGFLGLVCSGAAYWLWFRAVDDVGSTTTGTYLYLEPLVTLVAAALLLGETVHPLGVAGGVAVLAGVWLVSANRRLATQGHGSSDKQ